MVAGFVLDALFRARFWDYTNDFMNLNGRISIFFSFAWGIIALIFIHFIHPLVEKITKKFVKKIPVKIDTILSSIRYLNLF